MADIDVAKIQAQIQSFKSENPDKVSGKTDAEIISIMRSLSGCRVHPHQSSKRHAQPIRDHGL